MHKTDEFSPDAGVFLSGRGPSSFLQERPGCQVRPGEMPAWPGEFMAPCGIWRLTPAGPEHKFSPGQVPWQCLK